MNGKAIVKDKRGKRRAITVVGAMALLLAPLAWAMDRTELKPGWNMFSPQQDVEVGQQVAADAERQLPMLNDSRVDDYINTLGRRLAAKAPGEKYPYRFKVVNDRSINAFALPGGPVFINRGVIESADNESQLAGVLAHEISHVALRHGTNQASKASAAQVPLAILGGMLGSDTTAGVLTQLGASFTVSSILLKYSRTAETQADTLGTQILYDSGYDARAMAQFFEKIQALDQGGRPVEFFSNHPNPGNRIQRVGQEIDNLGGAGRLQQADSREFDRIKQRVQSLPAPTGGQLQSGRRSGAQSGAQELQILSARYGADDRFIDVRQRLQSRVVDNRLDLKVDNSAMGGDPIGRSKTLQLRYQFDGRAYDVTVRENQQLSIPTAQQISDSNRRADSGSGPASDWPSERYESAENALMRINYPDNWQAYGQGDAMTIAPRDGMVEDGRGNQAMAYGLIVNIYEPRRRDGYGQQLQGPGFGQGSGQQSVALLEQFTDELVQEFRLSNRNMRVIRRGEIIGVDGRQALSTYLSNDSPIGGRETNWLVTMQRPDGVLFFVFTAPDRDLRGYESAFRQMLYSVRIKQ